VGKSIFVFSGVRGPFGARLAAAARPQNGRKKARPRDAMQRSLGDAGWVKRASAFAKRKTGERGAARRQTVAHELVELK